MVAGRVSIAALLVRFLEAYLILIILRSGEHGITVGSVVVATMVVVVIEGIFRTIQRRVHQAVKDGRLYRAEDFSRVLAQALKRAQSKVTVFTYALPDEKVKETLGMVRGVSDTEASSRRDFQLAEQEALLLMLKQAYNKGANAVIGVSLTTGTYEANGSQWQVSRPVYTGTAVRI